MHTNRVKPSHAIELLPAESNNKSFKIKKNRFYFRIKKENIRNNILDLRMKSKI